MAAPHSIGTIEAQRLVNRMKPSYPVDIVWFLKKLNSEMDKQVQLIPCSTLPNDVSAALIQHSQFEFHYIVYNTEHTIERNRFSVAHEFGHLVLKHKSYSVGEDESPVTKKEADDFATDLLLPRARFINAAAVNRHLDPVSLAMKLRDRRHFWVSLEAACRKILDLGLFTGTFILYDRSGRYFYYNSDDFEPNEEAAKNVNRLLVGFENGPERALSAKTDGLFIYAKRFLSGQILAAVVTGDRAGFGVNYPGLQAGACSEELQAPVLPLR